MAQVDVAALEDLSEGVPWIVSVGRREIALLRWRDQVYAIRNICPHQSQSFEGGAAWPKLAAGDAPGEMVVDADRPVIACPWHYWRYELDSGSCVADPSVRVATYPVTVRDGRILLDPSPKRTTPRRARTNGHDDGPAPG